MPSCITSTTSRGTPYLLHFTLNWRQMICLRENSDDHSWPDIRSSPFVFGGHEWVVQGHVKTTVKEPSFIVLYPHTNLEIDDRAECEKVKPTETSKSSSDIFQLMHHHRSTHAQDDQPRPHYACHLPFKLTLLCREAYTRSKLDHERNLSVTTDDDGERFTDSTHQCGLQLVIPIGQLEDSTISDYVIDGHLHFRLICWPVRTVFKVHTPSRELFPWHPSLERKRFGHVCWESSEFLFKQAWWKFVLFPKGHGRESGQRLMVFLELTRLASQSLRVDQPLAMDGTLHVEHRKVPSAQTPGLQGSFSSSHALSHKFIAGEVAGCRDHLLLQAEIERVVTTLDVVEGSIQGAWCQPTQFATSFK